jgi:hypothetical protein
MSFTRCNELVADIDRVHDLFLPHHVKLITYDVLLVRSALCERINHPQTTAMSMNVWSNQRAGKPAPVAVTGAGANPERARETAAHSLGSILTPFPNAFLFTTATTKPLYTLPLTTPNGCRRLQSLCRLHDLRHISLVCPYCLLHCLVALHSCTIPCGAATQRRPFDTSWRLKRRRVLAINAPDQHYAQLPHDLLDRRYPRSRAGLCPARSSRRTPARRYLRQQK